jgi:deferrochelatase/peroxidase EfeB
VWDLLLRITINTRWPVRGSGPRGAASVHRTPPRAGRDSAGEEEIVSRHKYSGAPIGKKDEHDTPDFDAMDKEGSPVIAENAHVRLAAPESNDGAQILRRGYSYNDGVNFTAERWPPWRQAMEYDAGLLFVAYQRDVRTGFMKIFDTVAKLDAMNQFTTHIGSGIFACPRGVAKGEFIGQGLFSAA